MTNLQVQTAGMNGFGRFGLHLLKYWLDNISKSNFSIAYINDYVLDIKKIYNIITTDQYVKFSGYKISHDDNFLSIINQDDNEYKIEVSNS